MWDYDFIVIGEPASAKNQRRIVRSGGIPRIIKSAKALAYADSFSKQVLPRKLLEGDVALLVDVFYASRRPDLSCLDLIMDLLQGRVYANDRQVKANQSIWNLDRKNPRSRIRVRSVKSENSTGLSSFSHSKIWGI